jgi:hypothetical protein
VIISLFFGALLKTRQIKYTGKRRNRKNGETGCKNKVDPV